MQLKRFLSPFSTSSRHGVFQMGGAAFGMPKRKLVLYSNHPFSEAFVVKFQGGYSSKLNIRYILKMAIFEAGDSSGKTIILGILIFREGFLAEFCKSMLLFFQPRLPGHAAGDSIHTRAIERRIFGRHGSKKGRTFRGVGS